MTVSEMQVNPIGTRQASQRIVSVEYTLVKQRLTAQCCHRSRKDFVVELAV
jgi:hypothetical protein